MTGLGLQPGVVALAGASGLDIFVQTLAKALALGSLYALLALGFVLIYKTTQTLNFSQGALALTGTWFMSMVFIDWDIPGRFMGGPTWFHWFMALLVAVAVTAGLGMVIERLAIRPMIGEPLFSMAMITLALEVVLRTVSFDAVYIEARILGIPWGARTFMIGGAWIPWSYVAALLAALAAFAGTWMFFKTRQGIAMRATSLTRRRRWPRASTCTGPSRSPGHPVPGWPPWLVSSRRCRHGRPPGWPVSTGRSSCSGPFQR